MHGRTGRLLALIGIAAWALSGSSVRAQGPVASGPTGTPAYGEGPVAVASFGAPNCSSCGACGGICQTHPCPPHFHHCQERPPVICIKCGCPRPVCNPCALPNFGYFQACWTPWPLPPDWSHCPVPPPAAYVQLGTPGVLVPGSPGGHGVPGVPAVPGVDPRRMPLGNPAPGVPGAPPGVNPPPEESETFPQPRPMVPPPGKFSQ